MSEWSTVEISEEEFAPYEGETVGENDALIILMRRLPDIEGFLESGRSKRKMAVALLSQMEEKYWTEAFLQRVNLVPLFETFADLEAEDGEEFSLGKWSNIGEVKMTDGMRRMGRRYGFAIEQDQRAALVLEQQNRLGTTPTEEEIDAILAEKNQGPIGTYRRTDEPPVSDPVSGMDVDSMIRAQEGGLDVGNASTELPFEFAFDESSQGLERPAFATQDDIDLMFNTMSADEAINQYLDYRSGVAQFNAERRSLMEAGQGYDVVGAPGPADSVRVEFRENERNPYPKGVKGRGGVDPGPKRTYTVTEMLQLPFTMDRQQLVQYQKRLIDAGYLDKDSITGLGNPADPNFKRAHRDLLSQAAQTKTPMWELLGSAIKNNEEAKTASRDAFTAILTDPAAIRQRTQALARGLIGRRISDDEIDGFIKMVHDWERQTQAAGYESEQEGAEGGEIMAVDWEARMEEELRAANPDEAAAKDQVNQYESFRTMIGGPGYGPTRRGVLS